jgi:hypothetical protein
MAGTAVRAAASPDVGFLPVMHTIGVTMSSAPWQLPWLRLYLLTRELLKVSPASADWPEAKTELMRCAELRRAVIRAGWFN